MKILEGKVHKKGCGHFKVRMEKYPKVFKQATGEELYPGTLNIIVSKQIPIKEDFRIKGEEINEQGQDLLFEKCQINGINAYRIRPFNLKTRLGGHGDHILEITCSQEIPHDGVGSVVEITLFRDDI